MRNANQAKQRVRALRCLLWTAGVCLSLGSTAGELRVNVTGLVAPYGALGCSLFSAPAGFPMDNTLAKTLWVPASGASVSCTFVDVPAGKFALAVAHDTNGNRKLDTNFLGIPTEQWGVSNNVRPSLRAPRFDEAVFSVAADAAQTTIDIKVAQ